MGCLQAGLLRSLQGKKHSKTLFLSVFFIFSEKPVRVYNPWGLLNHFNESGKFQPYWYSSGTPTFLVKLITEQKINILDLNKLRVGLDAFCKYNADDMRAEPILYQSGYLTIVGKT